MNNEEIRYAILKALYDRHYNGGAQQHVLTEEIIKDAKLENEDRNLVDANIDYLKKAFLVEGLTALGVAIPRELKIESSGIDYVETRNHEALEYHGRLRFKILAAAE